MIWRGSWMDGWVLGGVRMGASMVRWVFWRFVGSWVWGEVDEPVGGWAGGWIGG